MPTSVWRICPSYRRDLWLVNLGGGRSRLILFDRRPDAELALNYGLTLRLPRHEAARALGARAGSLTFDQITPARLAELCPSVADARLSRTTNPSGHTLLRWLREVGFRDARPTHAGADFAGQLFDGLPSELRPIDVASLDALPGSLVSIVVDLSAPQGDYPVTAVR